MTERGSALSPLPSLPSLTYLGIMKLYGGVVCGLTGYYCLFLNKKGEIAFYPNLVIDLFIGVSKVYLVFIFIYILVRLVMTE